MMRGTRLLIVVLACWLSGAGARAELAVLEDFDYPAGDLNSRGETEVNGWSGPWDGQGLTVQDGAVVGRGHVSRGMIPRVDFELDDEWFFRVTLRRTGAAQGSDYCSVSLTNRDKAVSNTPFYMGINSQEKFYALAGPGEAKLFGDYDPSRPYVLIARLKTRINGDDELRVWVFPGDEALPKAQPVKPDLVMTCDYAGFGQTLELRTGNQDGYRAMFDGLRIGNSWAEMVDEHPESVRFRHPYRVFKFIRVADNGAHALPNSWSQISVLAWDDERPQLIQMSRHAWVPDQDRVYTQVSDAVRAGAEPKPGPQVPLFDAGRSFDGLPHGWYQAVPRQAGGYDLFEHDKATFIPMSDGKPRLESAYDPLDEPITGDNRHTHVADVDGDGVPDLLLTRLRESKWNYWPENGSPWKRQRQPLMGPDRDPAVNANMRGYDIAGNWLGSPITYELLWAQGRYADGRLRFDGFSPVYYGRDDFPLLWRNYSQRMACAVIERGGQRHIVLISASNEVLSMPVLPVQADGLHTGAATPLLSPEDDPYSLNMDHIWGVADLDADGLDEIIVGSGSSGFVTVLKGADIGAFRTHVVQMLGGPMAAATLSVPTVGDWDNDGRNDIVLGDGQGVFTFFPGTDDPTVYGGGRILTDADGRVVKTYGIPNIQGPQELAWGYTQPLLFDWDQDGQQDLIINDNTARFRLLRRVDPDDPTRVDVAGLFTRDAQMLPVAWRSRPAVIAGEHGVAGDDRPVLLYLDIDQLLAFGVPEKTGSMTIERVEHPAYTDGQPIRLANWGGLSGRVVFSAVDWDEDGKWDVLFSCQSANVTAFYDNREEVRHNAYLNTHATFWLRNVGTNSEPLFERARRIRHADGSIIRVETHAGNATPADLDGDGKALDLIFCDGPGFVYYFMRDELSW